MTTYNKQPISIADQISTLKNRGLMFDNDQAAIESLKIISYFRAGWTFWVIELL